MKTVKKLFASLLAVVMALALAIPAWAADNGNKQPTNTITINNATPGNTYTVYKVFDAKGDGQGVDGAIIYTLLSDKTTVPTGFTADTNGNVTYIGSATDNELTADDIAAIATYVKDDASVASGTVNEDQTSITIDVSESGYGYYYITTTTGTAVTVTSTNPNATVTDKNEAPELEKKITAVDEQKLDAAGQDALAQIGSKVEYTVTIEVKAGAQNYVFHDKMGSGLTYNNDIKVTVDSSEIGTTASAYTSTVADGDTITLTFENTWIATQVGKTITITYSATINQDALTIDNARNTASLDYGDSNTTNHTEVAPPTVHTAKIVVTKVDGKQSPLAGAGFVLTKNKGTDDNAKTVYYQKNNEGAITWVENIDDATEFVTTEGASGNVITFDGLGAGTYTLVEKTVPDGYNKAEENEDMTVTIANTDLTDDVTTVEKTVTVTNNAGTVLPSTGGIGTTIFYVIGGVLVVAAIVLLVTRKRVREE